MSSLPPEAVSALHQLLSHLTAADNESRSTAEKSLNEEWILRGQERQEMLLVGLAEQSVAGESAMMRSFAAVLFRRIATRQPPDTEQISAIIDAVSEPALAQIKNILLQGFIGDQTRDARHKIADAIAEIARPGTKSGKNKNLLKSRQN